VTRNSAKPRPLNVLKPLYAHHLATLERARAHLAAGRAVGFFPEGEVNRDPTRATAWATRGGAVVAGNRRTGRAHGHLFSRQWAGAAAGQVLRHRVANWVASHPARTTAATGLVVRSQRVAWRDHDWDRVACKQGMARSRKR
jgi:hypothetical protein